jgi:hypothetical protein
MLQSAGPRFTRSRPSHVSTSSWKEGGGRGASQPPELQGLRNWNCRAPVTELQGAGGVRNAPKAAREWLDTWDCRAVLPWVCLGGTGAADQQEGASNTPVNIKFQT